MEKNEEEVLDLDDTVETTDENGTDTTDWKAEALKAQGIAKRLKTKLDKSKEEKSEVEAKKASVEEKEKTDKTDLALEAYLIANGIKEPEERELFNERLSATGKTPKEVIENKFCNL